MADTPEPVKSQISTDLTAILRLLKDEQGKLPKNLPPVHEWNPPFCGNVNIEIKRNGEWYFMGSPISRAPLVKLFSSVLRHDEDGHFYLVTPVEKVRIRVEDAPFLATQVERHEEQGKDYLRFTTQTGDVVIASTQNPIRVEYKEGQEPNPYILVRDRLEALISRNVYYQLVEWGVAVEEEGRQALAVNSAGQDFVIGYF